MTNRRQKSFLLPSTPKGGEGGGKEHGSHKKMNLYARLAAAERGGGGEDGFGDDRRPNSGDEIDFRMLRGGGGGGGGGGEREGKPVSMQELLARVRNMRDGPSERPLLEPRKGGGGGPGGELFFGERVASSMALQSEKVMRMIEQVGGGEREREMGRCVLV